MKRAILLILTVLISIGLISCKDEPSTSLAPVRDPENCLEGDTIRIQRGDQFEISLYNPGFDGGYVWIFVDEFSDKIIEIIEYRFEEENPGLFGSPIYEIWKYDTKRKGMTCASLERKRPWLDNDPPVETRNIVVIVEW